MRSNYTQRKEGWKNELRKAREQFQTINDIDARSTLKAKAHVIDFKILAHNGEPYEYPEINNLISELNQLIKKISGWEKKISSLYESIKCREADVKKPLEARIVAIQNRIKSYKGELPSTTEIDRNIEAIELSASHANLDAIAKQNISRTRASIENKNETESFFNGTSLFSLFNCCRGIETGLADRKPLINQTRLINTYK